MRKHEFVLLDDNIHVHENPLTREPSWQHLVRPWRSPLQGLYVPLTYNFWTIQGFLAQTDWMRAWQPPRPAFALPHTVPGSNKSQGESRRPGISPGVFHHVSWFLHAANSLLVYGLLLTLFGALSLTG